ncbi:MAG: hypothetical protein AAGB22_16165, partial [Bacteroidota bacterium]
MRALFSAVLLSLLLIGCTNPAASDHAVAADQDSSAATADTPNATLVAYDGEQHFRNLRQLTKGGENAEAYWSFDNQRLVFQAANSDWQAECDQIFTFNPATDNLLEQPPLRISTGLGRTTCAYFLPGDTTIVYASTHLADSACPPVPERRADGKYVWPIYPGYDIFLADINGNQIAQLTDTPGYDAEATVSPKGDKMVFTSMRSGDLELYTMNLDGSDVRQITDALGYDGGAFFSPDGEKIIFRASRPGTEEEIATYRSLLDEGLVMPTQMELFVCNSDGSDLRQITQLGKANWCPFFHPSGEKVIFASNHTSERGFPFNLYMI